MMEPTKMPARRIHLQLDINYKKSYARQDSKGMLSNISLTGAFLKTDTAKVQLNEKIVLYFEVSGRRRKIQANVVWKNENGVGLAFMPFNNRDVQLIDDLMYFVESSRENRRSILETIFKKAI
ncbi:MAG: PilZ domain-containing protein [Bdellovibrionota bacterium]